MRRMRTIVILPLVCVAVCLLQPGGRLTRPSLAAGGPDAEPKPCAIEIEVTCPSWPDKDCDESYFGDCTGSYHNVCEPDPYGLHFCPYTEKCKPATGARCMPD